MKHLALLLLAMISLPASAFAYIDTGTGSIILQTLIGLAAGVWIFIKVFWHKLLGLFSRNTAAEENTSAKNDRAEG